MGKFNYKPALLCIVSALMLMGIALYNGYPIYLADAHAYLYTAFNPDIPVDRPIFYGKFIRITSLWTSLWLTIFAQSLILAWLLLRLIKLLNPDGAIFRFRLAAMVLIASLTCASWFCSILMADVFTAILLLSVILFLFDKNSSKLTTLFYVIIMFFSVMVHFSHFPIITTFSLFLIIYASLKKNTAFLRKGLVMLASGAVFYFTMCIINYNDKKKFIFSPASNVFLMAHFSTNGILDRYLDDNCEKKNLRICAAKGQLPAYHWDFLWAPADNPLSKIGIWDSSSAEFKGIVHDIFTTPEYLKMFASKSAVATCRQLFTIEVGRLWTPAIEDHTTARLRKYFGDEYKDFLTSRQRIDPVESTPFNVAYNLFFLLSSLVVLLVYAPRQHKEIYLIYAFILVYFVINAFFTATFSTVCSRFQGRIFWILPATNAILLLKYLQNRYSSILK